MNKEDIERLKDLWEFLDADMPSKIFSDKIIEIEGVYWNREDKFQDKEEVSYYLKQHFLLAFPELSTAQSNNEKTKQGICEGN